MTTIVGALRALATNEQHAVRKAIEALGAALVVLREQPSRTTESEPRSGGGAVALLRPSRGDDFAVRFRGPLRDDVRAELDRLGDAEIGGRVIKVAVGYPFELDAQSRPGRWILRDARAVVVIDDGHPLGWNLEITVDANEASLALARSLADALLTKAFAECFVRIECEGRRHAS